VSEQILKDISAKLDIVLRLLALRAISSDDLKEQEKIVLLDRVGLEAKRIAGLVGVKPPTVRGTLSRMRKKK